MSAETAWVFISASLGDFVLTWPLLRALAATHRGNLVTRGSHAALAAHVFGGPGPRPPSEGLQTHDAEQPRFNALWRGDATVIDPAAALVVSFVADESAAWWRAAAGAFPSARLISCGPPGSDSRTRFWRMFECSGSGAALPRVPPPSGSPIVCHIGAGGRHKRWPMDRWAALVHRLRSSGRPVDVIAGEVEAETFSGADRAALDALRGRVITDLVELADLLLAAALYVGADTGPTHLAAQLDVPTLALFGPTDPGIWSPVGPAVRILAPAAPGRMDWLTVEAVAAAAEQMATGLGPRTPGLAVLGG